MAESSESALVVLVPEVEPLVKPYRDLYDSSAAEGMPAHITILYPFLAPAAIEPPVIANLRQLFAGFSAFTFFLAGLRRFPDVLYLAPQPEGPFRALTQAIAEHYPETPPYGGLFEDVIPHLTLAQLPDPAQLDRIADEFRQECDRYLPRQAVAADVALMDNGSGRWQVQRLFPLRPD